MQELKTTLKEIGTLLNSSNIIQAVQKTITENSELRKKAEEMINDRIKSIVKQCIEEKKVLPIGINLVSIQKIMLPEIVKGVAFGVKEASPVATAFVGATISNDNKPLLTVMLTDDLVKKGLNASAIVREAAKLIHGGGGGQPQFAQAGGKSASGIREAFDKIIEQL